MIAAITGAPFGGVQVDSIANEHARTINSL